MSHDVGLWTDLYVSSTLASFIFSSYSSFVSFFLFYFFFYTDYYYILHTSHHSTIIWPHRRYDKSSTTTTGEMMPKGRVDVFWAIGKFFTFFFVTNYHFTLPSNHPRQFHGHTEGTTPVRQPSCPRDASMSFGPWVSSLLLFFLFFVTNYHFTLPSNHPWPHGRNDTCTTTINESRWLVGAFTVSPPRPCPLTTTTANHLPLVNHHRRWPCLWESASWLCMPSSSVDVTAVDEIPGDVVPRLPPFSTKITTTNHSFKVGMSFLAEASTCACHNSLVD